MDGIVQTIRSFMGVGAFLVYLGTFFLMIDNVDTIGNIKNIYSADDKICLFIEYKDILGSTRYTIIPYRFAFYKSFEKQIPLTYSVLLPENVKVGNKNIDYKDAYNLITYGIYMVIQTGIFIY